MKSVIFFVILTSFVSLKTYSQKSGQVVINSIDIETYKKSLLKLKELSKYKWGTSEKLFPSDKKETINQNYGGFKFLSNEVIEFNIGCGREAETIQCKLIYKKPTNTGIKLKIPNPDIFLTNVEKDDIYNYLGSFKIINDKKILGEYYFKSQNGNKEIFCGGNQKVVFTLVRLD